MNHPPLCPKTIDAFQDTPVGLVGFWPVSWGHLHEANPTQRRFIARYQACAWLDLAIEWESKAHSPHCTARKEAVKCEKNYHAWREWEKEVSDE